MTEKRFSIKNGSSIGLSSIYTDNDKVMTQLEVLDVLINQHETIEELKQEVEMLRNGLKAYDEALPLFLDCEDIMHFHSELFEFEMKRMDFYKEHPNRVHYSDRRD